MDNITHWLIWWSIFSTITGKYDNKNFLRWFAIGNLPDIDVLLAPLFTNNPIDSFFFHRSITHSIIFIFIISLLLTVFTRKKYSDIPWIQLFFAYFASIAFGHLMVDSFTSYGVRPLLPFYDNTMSTDNIFVVDIIMLISIIIIAIWRFISHSKKYITKIFLWFVSIYFVISFMIKIYINSTFYTSILNFQKVSNPSNDIYISNILTTPEPLQLFLRRWIVSANVNNTDWYFEWYYSIFDSDKNIDRKFYPKLTNQVLWPVGAKLWNSIMFEWDSINLNDRHLAMYINFSRWYNTYTYYWDGKFKVDNLIFGKTNWRTDKFERWFSMTINNNPTGSGYIYNIQRSISWSSISKQDVNEYIQRIIWIKK